MPKPFITSTKMMRRSFKITSWSRTREETSVEPERGTETSSRTVTTNATASTAMKAALMPNASESSVPIGVPKTLATEKPAYTNEMMRADFSRGTISLINVITVESRTPETTAVRIRATSSVSYVGAAMASRLPALNTAKNVTNNGNLRKRPVESTMMGVDTA